MKFYEAITWCNLHRDERLRVIAPSSKSSSDYIYHWSCPAWIKMTYRGVVVGSVDSSPGATGEPLDNYWNPILLPDTRFEIETEKTAIERLIESGDFGCKEESVRKLVDLILVEARKK